ncbi:hypothetical protein ABZW18_28550 [Streptomyces sp. NPDC004647]|uniref:hypothetical protein n=1 Tax=Streptomyces sp. NPDC004647 TaxID=3154671 RepID=UPI0033BF4A7B
MRNFWFALEAGAVTEELRSDLDRARREHRLRNAEAQMMVPDAVLAAAQSVHRGFGDLYGLLKRLDRGIAEPGESVDAAEEEMRRLWGALWRMRDETALAQGIPRAAMSPAVSGGRTVEPVTEEDF